jgi:ribosome-binding protein aMBF1 (putative translation factor)
MRAAMGTKAARSGVTSRDDADRLGDLDFAHRLTTARHEGMTQQGLADHVGIHVTQIRRYKAGTRQPTLDVLRALGVALSVSTVALVFNENERDPADPTLAIHPEALNRLDDDEGATILIESVLLRHELARTS